MLHLLVATTQYSGPNSVLQIRKIGGTVLGQVASETGKGMSISVLAEASDPYEIVLTDGGEDVTQSAKDLRCRITRLGT